MEIFKNIKSIEVDGADWYRFDDVCVALELVNSTVRYSQIDKCNKYVIKADTQRIRLISKSCLYRMIANSSKFKRILIEEILPEMHDNAIGK